jgi:beta-lactamase class C
VQAEMEKQKAVGVAIGIIQDGKIVYLQGYGWADRVNKVPVSPATMFRWAWCSKPVTVIAARQFVEKGQLDLDADVRKLVGCQPHHFKAGALV